MLQRAITKRLFNSTSANPANLIYAKRCENGQGSTFAFNVPKELEDHQVDVAYSTFWNDFTHYSFYGEPAGDFQAIESPVAYNQLSTSD